MFRSQRSALSLGNVGFATTTDVQRQLHPPDKQDVAARLLLELRRLALTDTESTHSVVSRGPEVLAHTTLANGSMLLKMSNTSVYVSAGILTGCTVIQTLPPTTARLTKSTNDVLFYLDAFHGDRDAHHSRSATSQTNTMQTPAMRTAVPSARVLVP